MSERIFGGVLLLVSLAGIWIGWDLQAPMSYEPVGPRAFPLLVLFLLGLCAIALMLEKKSDTVWAPPPVLKRIGLGVGMFFFFDRLLDVALPTGLWLNGILG